MSTEEKEKKVSPWTVFNKWLYDGSLTSKIPVELESDKAIGHMNFLYYFRASPYNVVLSKIFNNWGLFQLDRVELLYFFKECVFRSGYKPLFSNKVPAKKSKLYDSLKERYPFLKSEEVFMMVDLIDVSDEKDSIYETFGIYNPSKKKSTKAQKDMFEKEVNKIKPVEAKKENVTSDGLLEGFE